MHLRPNISLTALRAQTQNFSRRPSIMHSSEENFRNPYYGRLTFIAYFTGGVRAWDIRESQGPVEVGFLFRFPMRSPSRPAI